MSIDVLLFGILPVSQFPTMVRDAAGDDAARQAIEPRVPRRELARQGALVHEAHLRKHGERVSMTKILLRIYLLLRQYLRTE